MATEITDNPVNVTSSSTKPMLMRYTSKNFTRDDNEHKLLDTVENDSTDDDDSSEDSDDDEMQPQAGGTSTVVFEDGTALRQSADTTDCSVMPSLMFASAGTFSALQQRNNNAAFMLQQQHQTAALLQRTPAAQQQQCHNTTRPTNHSAANSAKPYHRRPKPPFSYVQLIAMAIRSSPSGRPTLQDINDYLKQHFEFFRGDYIGWKNSIRHNLSLNDCFHKVLRDPARPWGKDNYWVLNPHSEDYVFDDKGVMRRKRKRVSPRQPHHARRQIDKGAKIMGAESSPAASTRAAIMNAALFSMGNAPQHLPMYPANLKNCAKFDSTESAYNLATCWLPLNANITSRTETNAAVSAFTRPALPRLSQIDSNSLQNQLGTFSSDRDDGQEKHVVAMRWPALGVNVCASVATSINMPCRPIDSSNSIQNSCGDAPSDHAHSYSSAAAWLVLQQMQAAAHAAALRSAPVTSAEAAAALSQHYATLQSNAMAAAANAAAYYSQLFNSTNGANMLSQRESETSKSTNVFDDTKSASTT